MDGNIRCLLAVIYLLGITPPCLLKCSDHCSDCSVTTGCQKCKYGFFLDNGQCLACPERCITCESQLYCYECKSGHYGRTCDSRCGVGCVDNSCDKKSGKCYCKGECFGELCDNCIRADYVDRCRFNCEKCTCIDTVCKCDKCLPGHFLKDFACTKCHVNCPEGCESSTGVCTSCPDGKFSTFCTEECSTNCLGTAKIPLCNVKTGACSIGCSTPYTYGQFCNQTCNKHCQDNICDWITGICSYGCEHNYYGAFCDKRCSPQCEEPSYGYRCRRDNGTCVQGCVDGYYGSDCMFRCSIHCKSNLCDGMTGECIFGCDSGYTGDKCQNGESAVSNGESVNSNLVSMFGGAIGGALGMLMLVGLVVLAVVLLRRRARNTHHSTTDNALTFANVMTNNEGMPPAYSENTSDRDLPPVYEDIIDDGCLTPTAAAKNTTYENQSGLKGMGGQIVYEHLQSRDRFDHPYETVSPSLYENTRR